MQNYMLISNIFSHIDIFFQIVVYKFSEII